jgi:CheY-like chemotaxis protein
VPARILVVDDEPAVRALVSRVLREEGHEVVDVGNGQVAYGLALQESFDVVVTNNRMPGMTGPELVEALREHLPALPIVHLDDQSLGHGPAVQVPKDVIILPKPFEVEAIKSAVRALLPMTQ